MASVMNVPRLCFARNGPSRFWLYRSSGWKRRISGDCRSIKNILLQNRLGSNVKIQGWVKAVRKQKEHTFLHISDGTCAERIQVVLCSEAYDEKCCFNSAVEVSGILVANPKKDHPPEIQGSEIKVLGPLKDLAKFPFAPRKTYPPDYLRQFLHLRPKTNVNASILRLSSLITTTLHNTLIGEGYVHAFTPILTSNDCEGGGEVFEVKPASHVPSLLKESNPDDSYFGKKVHLTVSGQLHLEALAGGLSKVFTMGPTFRAENSRSRRHLAEFRMLEAELAFCDNLQPVLNIMELLIKQSASQIIRHGLKDVDVLNSFYKENIAESLERIIQKPFAVMTYKDAMQLLVRNEDKFKSKPRQGDDLGAEHELFIVDHTEAPTFVIDWPSDIKPFYMRHREGDESLVSCVDLLVPRLGELCGGSLRENRYDVLKDRLEKLKLHKPLDWYLDLRRYGGAPTGGFGMGVERLIAYLLKVPNVKDVTSFPRWPHNCQM